MTDSPGNGHYVQCPLCEGKGQMHRSDLVTKLADHDLARKLADCLEQLAAKSEQGNTAKSKRAGSSEQSDFEHEVLSGPVRRILWRRSPKE